MDMPKRSRAYYCCEHDLLRVATPTSRLVSGGRSYLSTEVPSLAASRAHHVKRLSGSRSRKFTLGGEGGPSSFASVWLHRGITLAPATSATLFLILAHGPCVEPQAPASRLPQKFSGSKPPQNSNNLAPRKDPRLIRKSTLRRQSNQQKWPALE